MVLVWWTIGAHL